VVDKRLKELRIIAKALSVPHPLELPDFKKLHYEFFDLLHELVVLPDFNWVEWGAPGADIRDIDLYNRELIQKHITRIVRSEKFVEGAFNAAIDNGLLPALCLRYCKLTSVMNKIKKCPVCKKRESVRKIQYGYPVFPVDEDIYALGGCVIFENQPSFRCLECGEEF